MRKHQPSKLKEVVGKIVNTIKTHPGATAAGALGLTGLGKRVFNKIQKNKGLAAFGLLGAAGGAYALANKKKKRAFDEDNLLEAYYAGLYDA
jgi:hypothetical protein